jgi:hypothetical protein
VPSCYVLLTARSHFQPRGVRPQVQAIKNLRSLSCCRWVDDDVFGRVLRCSRSDEDLIILDPVSFGAPPHAGLMCP